MTPNQQSLLDSPIMPSDRILGGAKDVDPDIHLIKQTLKLPIPRAPQRGHSLEHEEAVLPKASHILIRMSLGFGPLPALVTQYYLDGGVARGYKAVQLNNVTYHSQ